MRIMRIYACALLRIMPYAVMRIISVRICADAYDAHIRMCAAAHYAVMRIISVRICAYYAHIIRRCAYYAHMRM